MDLATRLKHRSNRICNLIFHSDMEWVDIAIEIEKMREIVEEEAPEKIELFERLYVSRFQRLWDQWRVKEQGF
jgi:hypothetical protein